MKPPQFYSFSLLKVMRLFDFWKTLFGSDTEKKTRKKTKKKTSKKYSPRKKQSRKKTVRKKLTKKSTKKVKKKTIKTSSKKKTPKKKSQKKTKRNLSKKPILKKKPKKLKERKNKTLRSTQDNSAKSAKGRQVSLKKPKEKEVGIITHYFGKISVGIIKLKSELKVGDKIHIKGATDDFKQTIKSMQYNHTEIPLAKNGYEIGIKVVRRVHENDKVYKIAG